MTETKTDILIIGAGPAGMSAAITLAKKGVKVIILDEQSLPGGQIYRNIQQNDHVKENILGHDYAYGKTLTDGMNHKNITHIGSASVWSIESGIRVFYTKNGCGWSVLCKRLIIATGAIERPTLLPGWTLCGVMNAGAGQILLKQSGVIANRAVIVGSGPLIYLIASQMIRAEAPPLALIETQNIKDSLNAMRYIIGALRSWKYLAKGLSMLREIRKAKITRYKSATNVTIEGKTKAEAVSFRSNGKSYRVECDTVYIHNGVIPNTQTARSINVEHRWSETQKCFIPVLDSWGKSNVEGVFIAGDNAGIGGAKVAEIAGQISALKIAQELGFISEAERDELASPLRSSLNREMAIRPFLDSAYPPLSVSPDDSTIICRCEEVTAGNIKEYARMGCLRSNQAKTFARVGMGECQGRYCGLAVNAILAEENKISHDQVGYFRIRPPIIPVTLGEIADMINYPQSKSDSQSE